MPITQNSESQFHLQLHSSSGAPLFPGPDFTNVTHSSPTVPVFQRSNLTVTLPPDNIGAWNQNQYVGPQSSPPSTDIQPWTQNQHHGPQSSPLSTVSNLQGNQSFTGDILQVERINFFVKLISGIVWQVRFHLMTYNPGLRISNMALRARL